MVKNNVSVKRNKEQKHGFIIGNIKNYVIHSTPKELFFDIIMPILVATTLVIIITNLLPNPSSFVKTLYEINGTIITIMAILAGFNSASLAIIASSSKLVNTPLIDTSNIEYEEKKRIQKIKDAIFNNPSYKELDAIVSFFAYAVISQLLILILSLLIHIVLTAVQKTTIINSIFNNSMEMIILFILSGCWFTLILHSIFLSIRNIDVIAHFIKFSNK